ncbi:hypothetical protein UA08_08650 [Talaromyces atroroseus]|uniref:Transcription factor domain-containing protein n=1 Tax=Talaromyces atroroseus TaxID=1441469 RepID=A0A225A808_TALAT|nr:hypothetical protein UA08_08650 [Talaromyces atroroseus]OKL55990.1 hypothetical protein UA08_08650 [Talaromyces atroroseus]
MHALSLSAYQVRRSPSVVSELLQVKPAIRIKSLYDKIDELSALVSMHASHAERSGASAVPSTTPYLEPFNYIVPYRTHQYLFLGPSPPVALGNVTIAKLQQLGVQIDSSRSTSEYEQLPAAVQIKCDRNSLSPSVVRLLLTYYARCIEPTYPTKLIQCGEGVETDLKQLSDGNRCVILLACATAAVHKSYHLPSWKALATACRDWAGDLAQPLIERRDDFSVFVLIMFIVYELADPQRGLIWEFISTATRICFQLGWHRVDEDPAEVSDDESNDLARGTLSTETRRTLLSVLINIERPLSVLSQRTPLLRASTVTWESSSDFAYNSYWQIIRDYFGTNPKRPDDGRLYPANVRSFKGLHGSMRLINCDGDPLAGVRKLSRVVA